MTSMFLAPAAGVFPVADGDAAILDARRGGRWHLTTGVGAALLTELLTGSGDVDAAVDALAARYPGTSPDRVADDASAFAARLIGDGLLRATDEPAPWPRSPKSQPVAAPSPSQPGAIRIADRLLAPLALAAALTARRTGSLRVCLHLVRAVSTLTSRPASAQEAEDAVQAVRAAAAWWPGRAACVETSLAAALLSAAHRRRVTWCIGARFAPAEFHAWIQADGRPIAETETGAWPYRTAAAA
jgi:hypothetical protein